MNGPLSTTEADLLAIEARYAKMIEDAKRIRQHLTHCEYGSDRELAGFDNLLCALGIHAEVVPDEIHTKPQQEMAATTGD